MTDERVTKTTTYHIVRMSDGATAQFSAHEMLRDSLENLLAQSDLQVAQQQCDEWQTACRNLERINAEQLAELGATQRAFMRYLQRVNECHLSGESCCSEQVCICWSQRERAIAYER